MSFLLACLSMTRSSLSSVSLAAFLRRHLGTLFFLAPQLKPAEKLDVTAYYRLHCRRSMARSSEASRADARASLLGSISSASVSGISPFPVSPAPSFWPLFCRSSVTHFLGSFLGSAWMPSNGHWEFRLASLPSIPCPRLRRTILICRHWQGREVPES